MPSLKQRFFTSAVFCILQTAVQRNNLNRKGLTILEKKSIFKDDRIEYIEDDVEKIRRKPGMYISYQGPKGALHLVREMVNNNVDEVTNPKSPGDTVSIFFDEKNNLIESSDNGRGLPFEEVLKVSTKIQSGSKFDRDDAMDSAGENGVGLTAINALSKVLKYTIFRQVGDNDTQKGIFEFNEGKFIKKKIADVRGAKHGTTFTCVPSQEVLGKCQIDAKELIDWVTKLSYLVNKKITMKLSILKTGKEIESVTKFKHKNGFVDYLDVLSKEQLVAPVYIKGSKDDVKVQVVFSYNPKNNEELVDSFANYVNTIEGGVHVSAARYGITSCLSKLANEALSDTEKKKFEITNDDCKVGLVMAVNLACRKPGFASQTKEKCGNDELFKPIRSIVYNSVYKHFKDNPKELQKLVVYLKKVAKSRLEVNKIRKSDVASFDSFTASTMSNFADSSRDYPYNELYIGEGLSAKGSIDKAKDPRFQAVYALRGLTANTAALLPAKVMENAELGTLVKLSGMGIGKFFDIKKSRYNKYIISTDADIDGYNITSSVSTFFLFHWRPVVEAGMLYKALTPLYKIKDGDQYRYIISRMEYFEAKVENYVKSIQLRDLKGHVLTPNEVRDFCVNNKTYNDILSELYKFYYTHPDIIEFVVRYGKDKDFDKKLKSVFPEMKYENHTLSGSYLGAYQFMFLDSSFDYKTEKLRELIDEVNGGNIYYDYKGVNDDTWHKKKSIGTINKAVMKYDPTIMARWKGLGTINPDVFWETVLNPNKRTLVQLTVTDLEEDMRKMRVLHGTDPKLRRELLQSYNLDKDDIDN